MAALPHEHHGNCPHRRVTLLSQWCSVGFWKIKEEFCRVCDCKTTASSPSSENQQTQPVLTLPALLERIRVHPEAKRILGNSCIPVVSLERMNFQSFLSLQPVVSLVRLPYQTPAELHSEVSLNHHQQKQQQNVFIQNMPDILELGQDSPEFTPTDLSDSTQPETTLISWTEPYCPGITPTEEPGQDSGFDCESHSDQAYILFDCGSDEWGLNGKMDSETFYLDPDPEQTMVIEVDPEPDTNLIHPLQLEDETDAKCVVDEVEMEEGEDQPAYVCCSQAAGEGEGEAFSHQPEPGEVADEKESDDFCAVCLNGGDLLCCDRCPKVYHLACHVPPVISFPLGDWVCTLCRADEEPAEEYDCESMNSCGGVKAPYTLSSQDQTKCEKLTLLLYCHWLSAPFHEPVSPLARNYYQIIKRPIDLSVIRRKLDKSKTLHYFSPEQFVDDVLLMFKNCATFNYPDSEVAQAGQNLETFFLTKLQEIFPDRTFVGTSQDRIDSSHIQLLSRKRKENDRKKKRYVFSGKKYYL